MTKQPDTRTTHDPDRNTDGTEPVRSRRVRQRIDAPHPRHDQASGQHGSGRDVQTFDWREVQSTYRTETDGGPSIPSSALTIELGRTRLRQADAAKLTRGTVVALGSCINEPVRVFVNQHFIARGQVVVVNGKLAVRVTERTSDDTC